MTLSNKEFNNTLISSHEITLILVHKHTIATDEVRK